MGANISVRWPGITELDEADQPNFEQDCHGYADWIARIKSSWIWPWSLRLRGLGALLSVHSSECTNKSISWTTPVALVAAAESLRSSLCKSVPFALKIAEEYKGGPGVEPAHLELATDLADVAEIGRYALNRGVSQVSLVVGW